MKHSELSTIYSAMKALEMAECKNAVEAHGGEYHFGNPGDNEENPDYWPHVYAGSNEIMVHIVRVDLTTGYLSVSGTEYYSHEKVGAYEWQIEFGGFHEMMDYMDEPSEK